MALRATAPAASPRQPTLLELPGHREECELVVRLSEPVRQHSDDAPEHLVGKILMQIQKILEGILRDSQEAAALVDARVRRSRRFIEERHLTEHRPRAEDGERLLTHPRNVAADADLTVDDDVHPIAGV